MKMICPYRDKCDNKFISKNHHCSGVHEKDGDCDRKCVRGFADITCVPADLKYFMKEVLKKA